MFVSGIQSCAIDMMSQDGKTSINTSEKGTTDININPQIRSRLSINNISNNVTSTTELNTETDDATLTNPYAEKVSGFAVLANEVNECDEQFKNGTINPLKHWNKINQLHTAEKMIDSVVDLLHIEAKNNPVRILGFRADGGVLGLLASGVSTIIVFFFELMFNR